jgi:hypothetical protein
MFDSSPAPSPNVVTFFKCPGQVNRNVNVVIVAAQGFPGLRRTTLNMPIERDSPRRHRCHSNTIIVLIDIFVMLGKLKRAILQRSYIVAARGRDILDSPDLPSVSGPKCPANVLLSDFF